MRTILITAVLLITTQYLWSQGNSLDEEVFSLMGLTVIFAAIVFMAALFSILKAYEAIVRSKEEELFQKHDLDEF